MFIELTGSCSFSVIDERMVFNGGSELSTYWLIEPYVEVHLTTGILKYYYEPRVFAIVFYSVEALQGQSKTLCMQLQYKYIFSVAL